MDIMVNNLCKTYQNLTVLEDLTFRLPQGAVTSLMAPSGKGNTTLLRILLGLETPDSGTIEGLEGKRRSAVLQEDRLCKNLTAISNIRLTSPSLKTSEILSAMETVGLRDCGYKPARELSGGMCQRIAILRALMAYYDILFLYEPFKGLDRDTRIQVMEYTKTKSRGKTVLLVTHDVNEATALGASHYLTL